MSKKMVETSVGFFIILGIVALLMLAFRVSGLTEYAIHDTYAVTADFNNIGDLKPRAPVTIAGVRIGQVQSIHLNNNTFHAVVTLLIDSDENKIPEDSEASILTAGLLGSNYIEITPGFEEAYLAEGSHIEDTHSAIILENMIGQLLFNAKKDDNNPSASERVETASSPVTENAHHGAVGK